MIVLIYVPHKINVLSACICQTPNSHTRKFFSCYLLIVMNEQLLLSRLKERTLEAKAQIELHKKINYVHVLFGMNLYIGLDQ